MYESAEHLHSIVSVRATEIHAQFHPHFLLLFSPAGDTAIVTPIERALGIPACEEIANVSDPREMVFPFLYLSNLNANYLWEYDLQERNDQT